MSTASIREALDYLENNPTADEAQEARRRARAELAAIETAAKTLHRLGLGSLDTLKDRVLGEGRMWSNEDADRWREARNLLAAIAKEET